MARRRNRHEERAIARQRMERLLSLAEAEESKERRTRYVRLARRIGMRYQVPVPAQWRRRVCRDCDALLVPGRNARVRAHGGLVRVTCLDCGRVGRFPAARRSPT